MRNPFPCLTAGRRSTSCVDRHRREAWAGPGEPPLAASRVKATVTSNLAKLKLILEGGR